MLLEGVLGQERAQSQLLAEAQAGRLAHAYLFVGPIGTGRGTTALALFKSLNCQDKSTELPCGECGSCRRAAKGQHEDLLVLAPPHGQASAQIKVEDVRQVLAALAYPPYGEGWRMVLIREAGHMNPTSANVLLKTLEEPPARNILVLTVQDPGEILPTLVSRCRRVNFQPLPEELIRRELVNRGQDESTARLRAGLCAGSLGRALGLDPGRLARELEQILDHLAQPHDTLDDWSFAEQLSQPFRAGERMDRAGLAGLLDLLALHFRDQAVAVAGQGGLALLGSPVSCTAQGMDTILRAFELVRQAQSAILSNAAPELTLVALMGQLRGGGG